jgi:hypothetical protein
MTGHPDWVARVRERAPARCASADGAPMERSLGADCACDDRALSQPAAYAAGGAAGAGVGEAGPLPLAGAAGLAGVGCGMDYGRLAAALTRHAAATVGHRVRQLLECELLVADAAHRLLAPAPPPGPAPASAHGEAAYQAPAGQLHYVRSCEPAPQPSARWPAAPGADIRSVTAAGACPASAAPTSAVVEAWLWPAPSAVALDAGGPPPPACVPVSPWTLELAPLPANDTLTVCFGANHVLGPRCQGASARCLRRLADGSHEVADLADCPSLRVVDATAAAGLSYCVLYDATGTGGGEAVCLDSVCAAPADAPPAPPEHAPDHHVTADREYLSAHIAWAVVLIFLCAGGFAALLAHTCALSRAQPTPAAAPRKPPPWQQAVTAQPPPSAAQCAASASRAARQRRASQSPQPLLRLPAGWWTPGLHSD